MHIRWAGLATAATCALTIITATPPPAAAAPAVSSADCPDGHVCLWREHDYVRSGCEWIWKPADGVQTLPVCLRDWVGSFKAEVGACFVDSWRGQIRQSHRAVKGDYSRAYKYGGGYGLNWDRIDPSC
ncbi:hypothetical protein AB0K48_28965 [Nonomuraea sp. NPDC055795]